MSGKTGTFLVKEGTAYVGDEHSNGSDLRRQAGHMENYARGGNCEVIEGHIKRV